MLNWRNEGRRKVCDDMSTKRLIAVSWERKRAKMTKRPYELFTVMLFFTFIYGCCNMSFCMRKVLAKNVMLR